MFDDLVSMLRERIPAQRADLIEDALNRLYNDFQIQSLDDFSSNLVAGAGEKYDMSNLDNIVIAGLVDQIRQQLMIFGVRVDERHMEGNAFRPLYSLLCTIFDSEHRDDIDYLLALVEDEDATASEVLANLTYHCYDIPVTKLLPLMANVQPELILRMQQVLAAKYEKETTVEDPIIVPQYIQDRLVAFSGIYSGVFFDYVNNGGILNAPFESMIRLCEDQLFPLRAEPFNFTWEVILFALGSTLANDHVVPTVRQVLQSNFPVLDQFQEANKALNEYLAKYGETLQ